MEGTYVIPNKNPYFFVTSEPKSDGFFRQNADNYIDYISFILGFYPSSLLSLESLLLPFD